MHRQRSTIPLAFSACLILGGCSDETIAGYLTGRPGPNQAPRELADPDPVEVAEQAESTPEPRRAAPARRDEARAQVAPAARPAPPPPRAKRAPAKRPPAKPAPASPPPHVDVLTLKTRGQTAIDDVYVTRGVGKSVYPTRNMKLRRRDRTVKVDPGVVYAGEKLTLVAAEPFNRKGEPLEFNYLTVRKASGAEGNIQIQYLSATPLNYDLTHPGDAASLLRGVHREALHAALQFHRTMARYEFRIPREPKEVYVKAYGRRQVYEAGFKFSQSLARNLNGGTTTSSVEILRNPLYRWASLAEDESVLAWYEDGCPDPALKARNRLAESLASNVGNATALGFALGRLADSRERKGWLRNTKGLPQRAVDKLNEKELAKIAEREADKREKLAAQLRRAGEAYVKVFGE